MSITAEAESLLVLTDNAVAQVKSLQGEAPGSPDRFLRVYVEKGGCSGMQYGLVFDEKRDGDVINRIQDVSVLVDSFSAEYLRGCVVDYVDSLTGGGFKISNPNARTSCGCGKSFEAS